MLILFIQFMYINFPPILKITKSDLFCKKIWPPYKITPSESVPFQRYCCKYNIFFTGRSLFTSNRKVDTLFRTHIHWFATVDLTRFSFSSLIYTNIKIFFEVYQQTLVSWLGKIFLLPNYWPCRSVLRWCP